MRVVYDATPLLMRSAGVKNYHHALLTRMLPMAASEGVEIDLFPYLDKLTPNHNERSNYPFPTTAARLAGVLASNYLAYPYAAPAAGRAALFHMTHHLMRPPKGPVLTSMVHDPTPLTMPECHTVSNVRYFERFIRTVAPRLAGIITPSLAVKQELVERYGLDEAKIRAIPHGVDPDFFDASPAQRQVLSQTYELHGKFILFLGSMEPRKNLKRLARAYDLLPEAVQREYPLIIAGAGGWKNDEIQKRLRKNKNIRTIGFVRRELLPALYASCSLFVFPSLYEGFGLPVVEAMAAGAPVVCSSVSALPEVVGQGALTVEPKDVNAIAEAMMKVLSDPNKAGVMADLGRQRARGFTWARTAEETLRFFRGVARGAA